MELFKVINPGLYSSIQDLGRYGYQKQGIVVSGTMDQFAIQAGNVLAGSLRNDAAIEITMMGPTLQALHNTIISICGANLSPMIDNTPIRMWCSQFIGRGQVLSFGKRQNGMRAYVCVSGGIDVLKFLNSSSTYAKGKMGGYEGRPLEAGDLLHGKDKEIDTNRVGLGLADEFVPTYNPEDPIRVILGPDNDCFTKKGIRTFLNSTYTISNSADRMGYRLEGPEIEHKSKADIISDAINLGSIQVPKDGNPIILMSDRQTTGGYTRIANVITADIPLIAQRFPGQTIKFKSITVEKTQKLWKQELQESGKRNFYQFHISK